MEQRKFYDTFYMIVTAFAGGLGNIVVKTKDPMQGWSEPYKLNFNGIDPSIFFDDDGKAYIVHNDAPDPVDLASDSRWNPGREYQSQEAMQTLRSSLQKLSSRQQVGSAKSRHCAPWLLFPTSRRHWSR